MGVKIDSNTNWGQGAYGIDLDGVRLGVVRKKVEHYNLIRPVTTTEWIVLPVDWLDGVERHHNRRRDAVDALVRAYRRSQKWERVEPIPGGNTDVWRCLSDCCGALCREARRDGHDDEFHAEEVAA